MIQIISTNETNHVEIKKSTCDLSCSKPATMTTNSDDQLLTRLGSDFRPGPFDIICARGMEARLHNEQFHEKIKESVDAYTNAESKLYKSIVVSSAVEWFRKASPNGGFVKESRGSWYRVSDFLAREKVSYPVSQWGSHHSDLVMLSVCCSEKWSMLLQSYHNPSRCWELGMWRRFCVLILKKSTP